MQWVVVSNPRRVSVTPLDTCSVPNEPALAPLIVTPIPTEVVAPIVVLTSTVTTWPLLIVTVSPAPGTPTSFQVVWPEADQLPVALLVKLDMRDPLFHELIEVQE